MAGPLKATIPATEVRTFKSRNVAQEYRVSIALPYSYLSEPLKRYPTIYLVDANFYFGMVTELTRTMTFCGEIPETIVVGIGYPLDEPLSDAFKQMYALRSRDFTPVVDRKQEEKDAKWLKVNRVRTGGAARFLQLIKSELIPMIETEYRASSTGRILVGHSYGGLFVLSALFQQPELFKGYVASSPSLWYGNKVMFKRESQFSKTHKALPLKLYLGVGELEENTDLHMVSNTIQFAACMESREYKDFTLVKQIIGNCGHCESTSSTFQAGLRAVLV